MKYLHLRNKFIQHDLLDVYNTIFNNYILVNIEQTKKLFSTVLAQLRNNKSMHIDIEKHHDLIIFSTSYNIKRYMMG